MVEDAVILTNTPSSPTNHLDLSRLLFHALF